MVRNEYVVHVGLNEYDVPSIHKAIKGTGYIACLCDGDIILEIIKYGVCQYKVGRITRREVENLGLSTAYVATFIYIEE